MFMQAPLMLRAGPHSDSSISCLQIKRADVARAFILHHHGGLYLDMDVQCFRDPTDTLTDFDFVIQGYVLLLARPAASLS